MTDKTDKLTPTEEAFATHVASGQSQAEAYRQAFPRSRRWKDATIYSKASTLAATEKVQKRVRELGEKATAANDVTVERVVRELSKIAFGNQRQVMKWGPNGVSLLPSDELDEDAAAMVSEVSESVSSTGGSIKLKTHDKVKALELLGKHLGIFIDKTELTGKGGKDLVPEPKGILVVPATMDEAAWQTMALKGIASA